ncbi:hypothetical protein BDV18DRAFT_130440 [Aspergillus unguis]
MRRARRISTMVLTLNRFKLSFARFNLENHTSLLAYVHKSLELKRIRVGAIPHHTDPLGIRMKIVGGRSTAKWRNL